MHWPMLLVALLASAVFVILAVVAHVPTYRMAPVFLLPAVWGLYLLRCRLHLHTVHFAVLTAVLVLHDLGALGMYQRGVAGISWDVWVHTTFGLAATLVVHEFLRAEFSWRVWGVRVASLLCVMGLGALHEVMEYASYLLLGEAKGMLKPSTSYFFDTQRDLTCNLVGSLIALAIVWLLPGRRQLLRTRR